MFKLKPKLDLKRKRGSVLPTTSTVLHARTKIVRKRKREREREREVSLTDWCSFASLVFLSNNQKQ